MGQRAEDRGQRAESVAHGAKGREHSAKGIAHSEKIKAKGRGQRTGLRSTSFEERFA